MSDKDKPDMKVVHPIPQITSELQKALEECKRNEPYLIQYNQIQAKIIKAKYDALVVEGFSPAYALELCKGE